MSRATLARLLVGGVLAVSARPGQVPAQEQAVAPPSDAASLVRQLGSESFQEREVAMLGLARLGVAAKPALLAGLDSPDAEVRQRCRRVLEVVLDLDFRERVRRFAADSEGRQQHDVPGWKEFAEMTGGVPAARDLYVEVLEAEPHLIEVLGSAPQSMNEMVLLRAQQLQLKRSVNAQTRQPQEVSLGSIVALLFVTAHPSVNLPDNLQTTTLNYLNYPAFQQAINAGPRADMLRALVGAWIRRGQGPPYQMMTLALRYQLPDGIQPALAVVRQQQVQPQIRMQALLVVGRFGTREHIPLLEQQLADKDAVPYRVNRNPVPTQVRDVALAVLVKLTGQKLADYGFDRAQEPMPGMLALHTLGFPNDELRQAALDKWTAWRQENAVQIPLPPQNVTEAAPQK